MSRAAYEAEARAAARRHGVPEAGYVAQIGRESAWNPHAVSPVGAMGLAQFMPATWAEFGNGGDPFDPAGSLEAGARYMAWIRSWLKSQGLAGTWSQTLAAYNAGIGRVRSAVQTRGDGWLAAMPAETRAYVTALAPSFGSDGGPGRGLALVAAVVIGALVLA